MARDLFKILVDLYADQRGVKITYQTEKQEERK